MYYIVVIGQVLFAFSHLTNGMTQEQAHLFSPLHRKDKSDSFK